MRYERFFYRMSSKRNHLPKAILARMATPELPGETTRQRSRNHARGNGPQTQPAHHMGQQRTRHRRQGTGTNGHVRPLRLCKSPRRDEQERSPIQDRLTGFFGRKESHAHQEHQAGVLAQRDIANLNWDARLVFIGLWSYVDDNGVGKDIDYDISRRPVRG